MNLKPQIGAIVFHVQNVQRSLAFYRDTLAFPVRVMPAVENEEHHGEWFMAMCGPMPLIFFEGSDKPGKTPIVVFDVDEGGIDDLVENLARKGVQFITPVSKAPGGWSADFIDPDGHTLGTYQPDSRPRSLKP